MAEGWRGPASTCRSSSLPLPPIPRLWAARRRSTEARLSRRRGLRLTSAAMRKFTKAEIAEFYHRLAESRPIPRTELEFINPFTLLVAVVLSAQATDVGVNRATPALFAAADTPQKMVALGEARVRDLIKTIGLYRTKAKNIVRL